jgi:hypothetical protein
MAGLNLEDSRSASIPVRAAVGFMELGAATDR